MWQRPGDISTEATKRGAHNTLVLRRKDVESFQNPLHCPRERTADNWLVGVGGAATPEQAHGGR